MLLCSLFESFSVLQRNIVSCFPSLWSAEHGAVMLVQGYRAIAPVDCQKRQKAEAQVVSENDWTIKKDPVVTFKLTHLHDSC